MHGVQTRHVKRGSGSARCRSLQIRRVASSEGADAAKLGSGREHQGCISRRRRRGRRQRAGDCAGDPRSRLQQVPHSLERDSGRPPLDEAKAEGAAPPPDTRMQIQSGRRPSGSRRQQRVSPSPLLRTPAGGAAAAAASNLPRSSCPSSLLHTRTPPPARRLIPRLPAVPNRLLGATTTVTLRRFTTTKKTTPVVVAFAQSTAPSTPRV